MVNADGRTDFEPDEATPRSAKAMRRGARGRGARGLHPAGLQLAGRASPTSHFPEYDTDWNSEAYLTVSGQNSQQLACASPTTSSTVLEQDGDWDLDAPHRPARSRKTLPARELWDQIAEAAWACADPGLQYDTTINEWHTCPDDGRINASNPCSEYMFLDDTACNLASLNLHQVPRRDDGSFDVDGYRHALPAVDDRARDQRADGRSSRARRSPRRATSSARSASATPTSARC